LETHSERGQVTDLEMAAQVPVVWVRLRLVGGIQMLRDQMFLEFGEIIGNGTQEMPELVTRFSGSWWDRGVRLTLFQDGPAVRGCYDSGSPLTGTVTGNLLKATGIGVGDEVVSLFILGVTEEGHIRGVRSTNGAPFAMYTGAPAGERTVECSEPTEPPLGCGSVIHGINFGFDSAELLPESDPVLEKLAEGLADDPSAAISIEGHTSSEGDEAYNTGLSERRAQAVVDDLVSRGIEAGRLTAVGHGEARPIASNDDENGRAMNRRVEVRCGGGS
jgi:outer membrane protein OmpA-like peptidoglycan-associated protein